MRLRCTGIFRRSGAFSGGLVAGFTRQLCPFIALTVTDSTELAVAFMPINTSFAGLL